VASQHDSLSVGTSAKCLAVVHVVRAVFMNLS